MAAKTLGQYFGINAPKVTKSRRDEVVKCINWHQLAGIEIEVENVEHDSEWYSEELFPQFNVTTDGSLRGDAYEFVSNAMTIGGLLSEIHEFYSITGFTENNFTDRCSIHVHANVLDMTADQLAAVCLAYQTVEEILFRFVGNDRDTNIYCIPWAHCKMNYKLVANLVTDSHGCSRSWQKYTALNLQPIHRQGTIEFRHMHGTADVSKISLWLQIIASLMHYGKTHSLGEVYETIRNLNTTSNYHQYFEQVFNGLLPYTPEYMTLLEEGVLLAKYAMIHWTPEKKSAKKAPEESDPFPEETPAPTRLEDRVYYTGTTAMQMPRQVALPTEDMARVLVQARFAAALHEHIPLAGRTDAELAAMMMPVQANITE